MLRKLHFEAMKQRGYDEEEIDKDYRQLLKDLEEFCDDETCHTCDHCRVNGEVRDGKIICRCRINNKEVDPNSPACEEWDMADPAADKFESAKFPL